MNDDTYRPSPALDYQEYMRWAEESLRTRGYTPLPVEYLVLPNALAFPPGSAPPIRSDHERLNDALDKQDILEQQLVEIKEFIQMMRAKLND